MDVHHNNERDRLAAVSEHGTAAASNGNGQMLGSSVSVGGQAASQHATRVANGNN